MIDPPALAGVGVGFELGAIHIAQIDHDPIREVVRNVLPHLARKDENRVDPVVAQSLGNVAAHSSVIEGGEADRFTLQHRFDTRLRQWLGAFDQRMCFGNQRKRALLRHIM